MNHRKNTRRFFAVIAIVFAIQNSVGYAQPDVYLSFSAFGDGDAVNSTFGGGQIGNSVSAYIWVDENFSIDTSACFNIVRTGDASIEITGVEVFNPDICGSTVDVRWQAVSVGQVFDDSVADICGTAVGGGTGILPAQSSGNDPFDTLHDEFSFAFLFARVDFDVVAFGTTNLEFFGSGAVFDGGGPIVPSYGSITIIETTLFGDINLDGAVSLLDVSLFPNLIFTATYQLEGDMNMDGVVNVHDIPLFISVLTGG